MIAVLTNTNTVTNRIAQYFSRLSSDILVLFNACRPHNFIDMATPEIGIFSGVQLDSFHLIDRLQEYSYGF